MKLFRETSVKMETMKYFICLGIGLSDYVSGSSYKSASANEFFNFAKYMAMYKDVTLYLSGIKNSCQNKYVLFNNVSDVDQGFFYKKEVYVYCSDINALRSIKNSFNQCRLYIFTEYSDAILRKQIQCLLYDNDIRFIDSYRRVIGNCNSYTRYLNDLYIKNSKEKLAEMKDALIGEFIDEMVFLVDVTSVFSTFEIARLLLASVDNCSLTFLAQDEAYASLTQSKELALSKTIIVGESNLIDVYKTLSSANLFIFTGVGKDCYLPLFQCVAASGSPWVSTASVAKLFGFKPTFYFGAKVGGNGSKSYAESVVDIAKNLKNPLSVEYKKWLSNLEDTVASGCRSSTLLESELSDKEELKEVPNLLSDSIELSNRDNQLNVVWIGRFDFIGGYGEVARGYLKAMEAANIRCLCIDIDQKTPVGKADGFFWRHDHAERKYIINGPSLLVINDLPTKYSKFKGEGFVSRVGCTLFETDSFPVDWVEGFSYVDEVWVPTHFNFKTFVDAGLPKEKISILGYAVDTEFYAPANRVDDEVVRLLYIVSNLNRKDPGLLLRAYYRAFSRKDNVLLTIKTRLMRNEFVEAMKPHLEPNYSFEDTANPKVELVTGTVSNDVMRNLYSVTDLYVTTERAKGWDYPALEAMSMGIPSVSLDWSGSEFLSKENSYLIPVKKNLVTVHSSQVDNAEMYFGHKWADVDEGEIVKALQKAVISSSDRKKKSCQCVKDSLNFSADEIGKQMKKILLSKIGNSYKSSVAQLHY